MQPTGTSPQRRGLAAFGPYLEERKGTQELLLNRHAKTGHDVFLARHQGTSSNVLVHRLAVDSSASSEARHDMVTAAGQALAFRHASVLTVTEVLAVDEDLILVQEFPGGSLLRDAVVKEGPLPAAHAIDAMRQFAEALRAAQQQRLTLSQISPQDFILGHSATSDSRRPLFSLCPSVPEGWWLEVDDPAFASPEQTAGQSCDIRSALFSAGATLAYALSGQQPADGEAWTSFVERMNAAKEVKTALLSVLHDKPQKRVADPSAWLAKLDRAYKVASTVQAPSKGLAPTPSPIPEAAKKAKAAPKPPADLRAPNRTKPVAQASPPVPKVPAPARLAKLPQSSSSALLGRMAAALAVCAGLVWAAWHITQRLEHQSHTSHITPEITSTRPLQSNKAVVSSPLPAPPLVALPPLEPMPLEPEIAAIPLELPSSPSPQATVAFPLPALVTTPSDVRARGDISEKEKDAISAKEMALQPDPDPNLDSSANVRRAQLASPEELLLQEARQAPPARRLELYRQVLHSQPQNREALHGLVENALTNLATDQPKRRDVLTWATALDGVNDPLGPYTRGRLLLQDAEKSANLRLAATSLTNAVEQLDRAADLGYRHAWFLLLQAYVNLHNVQQQAGNDVQAARTSRRLFEKIDTMPTSVPVRDSRLLAERLEQLLTERETQGKPHPQAIFLRRVVERLHAVASERGDTVSQVWLRAHDAGG